MGPFNKIETLKELVNKTLDCIEPESKIQGFRMEIDVEGQEEIEYLILGTLGE